VKRVQLDVWEAAGPGEGGGDGGLATAGRADHEDAPTECHGSMFVAGAPGAPRAHPAPRAG